MLRGRSTGYFDTAGRLICVGDIVRYAIRKISDYDFVSRRHVEELIWKTGPVIATDGVFLPLKYAVKGSVTIVESRGED